MFEGFRPESVEFLRDLRSNNNRPWFEENRSVYEEFLAAPFERLTLELGPLMTAIDPALETRPYRAISRIHRDTRFSRDKSPYKSVVWLTFKRLEREWMAAPAFYFELSPEGYRYGMGFYTARRETMDLLRQELDERPAGFLERVAFLDDRPDLVLEGEAYRRPLKAGLPPELDRWYQRKNAYLACNRPLDGRVMSRALLDDLRRDFALCGPLYTYLRNLAEASGAV